MKRYLAIVLALVLTFTAMASAEGVIILAKPETQKETVNFDDIKDGQTVVIDGFGEITFNDKGWQDNCGLYSTYGDPYRYKSGPETEYYVLRVDILNTQYEAANFEKTFGAVTCNYGNGYVFGGFHKQTDAYQSGRMDNGTDQSWATGVLRGSSYLIIVQLPNAVKDRTNEPLSITFTINENEFTRIVRK